MRQIVTIFALLLIQLLFFLSFTLNVIPAWEKYLTNLQLTIWVFDIVLAIVLLYKFARQLWQSEGRRRIVDRLASTLPIVIAFALMTGFLFVMLMIIRFKDFAGIYCSYDREEIDFPRYGKSVYLKERSCRDGYPGGGTAYIHEGMLPLMKPVFTIHNGSLEVSQLKQNNYTIRIYGNSVNDFDPNFNKVVFYNLKTGEIKTVSNQES